jgi:hypothetical protein
LASKSSAKMMMSNTSTGRPSIGETMKQSCDDTLKYARGVYSLSLDLRSFE